MWLRSRRHARVELRHVLLLLHHLSLHLLRNLLLLLRLLCRNHSLVLEPLVRFLLLPKLLLTELRLHLRLHLRLYRRLHRRLLLPLLRRLRRLQ